MIKKALILCTSTLVISSAFANGISLEEVGKDILNHMPEEQIIKNIDSKIVKSSNKVKNSDVNTCLNAWNKLGNNAFYLTSADIGANESKMFKNLYSEDNYIARRNLRVAVLGILMLSEQYKLCNANPSFYYKMAESSNYRMINYYHQFNNNVFDLQEQSNLPSKNQLNRLIQNSK